MASYQLMPPCPRCNVRPANDQCRECGDGACHVCSRRFCSSCGAYHCVNCRTCLALWHFVSNAGGHFLHGEFVNGSQTDFVCIYCKGSVVGPQLPCFPEVLRNLGDGTVAHLHCIRGEQHPDDDSSDSVKSGEDNADLRGDFGKRRRVESGCGSK